MDGRQGNSFMSQASTLTFNVGNAFKRLTARMKASMLTKATQSIDVLRSVMVRAAYTRSSLLRSPSEERELYQPLTQKQHFKNIETVFHLYHQGLTRGNLAVLVNMIIHSRQQHRHHSVFQPVQTTAHVDLKNPKGLNWIGLTQVGVTFLSE